MSHQSIVYKNSLHKSSCKLRDFENFLYSGKSVKIDMDQALEVQTQKVSRNSALSAYESNGIEVEIFLEKNPPNSGFSIESHVSIVAPIELKMTSFQAYFALLKAYCAINVLLLPKAFKNGGYLLSPIALFLACFFECTCAIKLS